MLKQTLDDFRLTRGERQALSRILKHVDPSSQMLSQYRKIAFELAGEAIAESGAVVAGDVVGWLEDVTRVLQALSGSSHRVHTVETYFSPDEDCVGRIRGFLDSAKSTADVCVFTITDNRISERLLAAHRRGVRVRIISDNEKAYDRGSDVDLLSRKGVPLRVDSSPYHMHHKFAIVDESKLLTGSYNWTRTAAAENQENFIITEDPRLVDPFAKLFAKLWDKFA